ncbi:MarR family transcriptional regulator [Deinococcus radiophilus]|uniref:MarR family transcriptional regulator n=1 Tax=Deinococcus radiophilus TaxID=32062 RepID=A0A3S0RDF1_9DEIO|nr:MarR family transcriptional regulator [Deinococcus radiophilus]RTR25590.1 MarR family transcriptional regulator [Deinococcus radiophilus]UFA51695.1 MarR family transcriptional regulator [Deinococcus radiophilus]
MTTLSETLRVLDFLTREAPKAHSADELAALLELDTAAVQVALTELERRGEVSPEQVSGYGDSDTLWRAAKTGGAENS